MDQPPRLAAVSTLSDIQWLAEATLAGAWLADSRGRLHAACSRGPHLKWRTERGLAPLKVLSVAYSPTGHLWLVDASGGLWIRSRLEIDLPAAAETGDRPIVTHSCYENERWSVFSQSWSKQPDKTRWTKADGQPAVPPEKHRLPSSRWTWESEWYPERNHRTDEDGWQYSKNGRVFLPKADNADFARRRRWLRRRCLVDPNAFWFSVELPKGAKAASVAINEEGAWVLSTEWEMFFRGGITQIDVEGTYWMELHMPKVKPDWYGYGCVALDSADRLVCVSPAGTLMVWRAANELASLEALAFAAATTARLEDVLILPGSWEVIPPTPPLRSLVFTQLGIWGVGVHGNLELRREKLLSAKSSWTAVSTPSADMLALQRPRTDPTQASCPAMSLEHYLELGAARIQAMKVLQQTLDELQAGRTTEPHRHQHHSQQHHQHPRAAPIIRGPATSTSDQLFSGSVTPPLSDMVSPTPGSMATMAAAASVGSIASPPSELVSPTPEFAEGADPPPSCQSLPQSSSPLKPSSRWPGPLAAGAPTARLVDSSMLSDDTESIDEGRCSPTSSEQLDETYAIVDNDHVRRTWPSLDTLGRSAIEWVETNLSAMAVDLMVNAAGCYVLCMDSNGQLWGRLGITEQRPQGRYWIRLLTAFEGAYVIGGTLEKLVPVSNMPMPAMKIGGWEETILTDLVEQSAFHAKRYGSTRHHGGSTPVANKPSLSSVSYTPLSVVREVGLLTAKVLLGRFGKQEQRDIVLDRSQRTLTVKGAGSDGLMATQGSGKAKHEQAATADAVIALADVTSVELVRQTGSGAVAAFTTLQLTTSVQFFETVKLTFGSMEECRKWLVLLRRGMAEATSLALKQSSAVSGGSRPAVRDMVTAAVVDDNEEGEAGKAEAVSAAIGTSISATHGSGSGRAGSQAGTPAAERVRSLSGDDSLPHMLTSFHDAAAGVSSSSFTPSSMSVKAQLAAHLEGPQRHSSAAHRRLAVNPALVDARPKRATLQTRIETAGGPAAAAAAAAAALTPASTTAVDVASFDDNYLRWFTAVASSPHQSDAAAPSLPTSASSVPSLDAKANGITTAMEIRASTSLKNHSPHRPSVATRLLKSSAAQPVPTLWAVGANDQVVCCDFFHHHLLNEAGGCSPLLVEAVSPGGSRSETAPSSPAPAAEPRRLVFARAPALEKVTAWGRTRLTVVDLAVSPLGLVWVVDAEGAAHALTVEGGAHAWVNRGHAENPLALAASLKGADWTEVPPHLFVYAGGLKERVAKVALSMTAAWTVTSAGTLLVREGVTVACPLGKRWQRLECDDRLKAVSVMDGAVMVVTSAGKMYTRVGFSPTYPYGTHWLDSDTNLAAGTLGVDRPDAPNHALPRHGTVGGGGKGGSGSSSTNNNHGTTSPTASKLDAAAGIADLAEHAGSENRTPAVDESWWAQSPAPALSHCYLATVLLTKAKTNESSLRCGMRHTDGRLGVTHEIASAKDLAAIAMDSPGNLWAIDNEGKLWQQHRPWRRPGALAVEEAEKARAARKGKKREAATKADNSDYGWRVWECVDDTETRQLLLRRICAVSLHPRSDAVPLGYMLLGDDTLTLTQVESQGGEQIVALLHDIKAATEALLDDARRKWCFLCPPLIVRTYVIVRIPAGVWVEGRITGQRQGVQATSGGYEQPSMFLMVQLQSMRDIWVDTRHVVAMARLSASWLKEGDKVLAPADGRSLQGAGMNLSGFSRIYTLAVVRAISFSKGCCIVSLDSLPDELPTRALTATIDELRRAPRFRGRKLAASVYSLA